MLRAALVLVVIATTLGVLMPSGPSRAPSSAAPEPVIRTDLARVRPVSRQLSGAGMVSLPRDGDGHFYADVQVNGSDVHFVVDTGATVIALTRRDAERAGLNVDPDEFAVVAQGASGPVMGVPVVLRQVTLGTRTATDVPALVLADAGQSLLGQNFLSGFDMVSIERDQMVLR